MSNKPFSTRTLAEYWGCTEQHIRDLIKSGELKAFRIGRLYRITCEEVKRVEQCDYNSLEENGQSTGEKKGIRAEFPYVPPINTLQNSDSVISRDN